MITPNNNKIGWQC